MDILTAAKLRKSVAMWKVCVLFACVVLSAPVAGATLDSKFTQLSADQVVGASDATLLSYDITLPSGTWVYFQSDGRVIPTGGGAIATVAIMVDEQWISNASIVNWAGSLDAQQHSFNNIGATYLASGVHHVSLHANSQNGVTFSVGAGASLAALVDPAAQVATARRGADSDVISLQVSGIGQNQPLPSVEHISIPWASVPGDAPVVALSSARVYGAGENGDPLTTIGMDGASLPNDRASWSDNDTWQYAEYQAPFFTHALLPSISGAHRFSLLSSALPYDNHVQYRVGGDSNLVVMQGGMLVVGSAPVASDAFNVTNYLCIATSSSSPGCPTQGSAVPVSEADIVVPAGHNGVVFITGKTRVQGNPQDGGGTVSLFLTIDGALRGAYSVQQIAAPAGASTRTMGASYLATGSAALAPGTHHIVLYGQATGNFAYLYMTRDLPLIWFD